MMPAWKKNLLIRMAGKMQTVTSGPDGVLTAQMQPPIRITKIIEPVSIHEAGKDTFIVDMGQNFAGVARIKVKGTKGSAISLRYGEAIYANGSLNCDDICCRAYQRDMAFGRWTGCTKNCLAKRCIYFKRRWY